jgi:activator of HSP90 ATPase
VNNANDDYKDDFDSPKGRTSTNIPNISSNVTSPSNLVAHDIHGLKNSTSHSTVNTFNQPTNGSHTNNINFSNANSNSYNSNAGANSHQFNTISSSSSTISSSSSTTTPMLMGGGMGASIAANPMTNGLMGKKESNQGTGIYGPNTFGANTDERKSSRFLMA